MDPVTFILTTVAQVGIAYLFPSEGPRLKDLKISASTYGNSIPEVFGVARVPGNMIWSTPIKEHKRKMSTLAAKGGFFIQYTYTCSFAMAFCQGPVDSIRKLWADGKLIYDISGTSLYAHNRKYKFKVYNGDEYQLPNSTIEADKGVGNTPAYRGLCYIVFEDMPIADFGNRIPQFTAEVFRNGASEFAPQFPMRQAGPGAEAVSNYQEFELTVDTGRSQYWLTALDNSTNELYLRCFSLDDGKEQFQVRQSQMNLPLRGTFATGAFHSLLGVSPSAGYLVVAHDFANFWPISLLDPRSFEAVATIGNQANFLGDYPDLFQPTANYPRNKDWSVSHSGEEALMYRSLFGELVLLSFTDLPGAFKGETLPGNYGNNARDSLITGVSGEIICQWYVTSLTDEHTIDIFRVDKQTVGAFVQKVFTITRPDDNILFQPIQSFWDYSAVPGLIVIYNYDGNTTYMFKWSPDTGEVLWKKQVPTNVGGFSRKGDVHGGRWNVLVFDSGLTWNNRLLNLFSLDTITGEWITDFPAADAVDPLDDTVASILSTDQQSYNPVPVGTQAENSAGQVSAWQNTYFDDDRGAIVATVGTAWPSLVGLGVQVGYTNLGSILESMLRRAGLREQQFDMSLLYPVQVRGYGWARGTDVKSLIEELRRVYLFDIVERQGRLVGVPRGAGSSEDAPGTAVATIPQAVLGSSSSDANDFWVETRTQEAELPESVSLAYMNFDDDYQTSTAASKRIANPVPAMFSRQQVNMQVSVVMSPVEAKRQMNKALYSAWAERTRHSTRLPWAYLDLDPADLITVTMNDGRSFFERLHQTEIGADYAIASESYGQDSGAYTQWDTIVSTSTTDGGGSGSPAKVPVARAAIPLLVNTPLLRDQDDTGGSFSLYYAGVGNAVAGTFDGASMWRSAGSLDYSILFSTDVSVSWGRVPGVVPAPKRGFYALDWDTKITVWGAAEGFALDSCSDDQLWAGANACLIGDEIIQFRDAVENADGSWTIWNLLRGRRGTEYACDAHKPAESFVMLSDSTLLGQGDVLDARGQQRSFIAIGEGREPFDDPPVTIVYEPRDLMPYAPSDIRRSISGSTVTVTWARRTRMGGNMQNFTGTVPLNEVAEKYEVYFLAAPFAGDMSRGLPPDSYLHMVETTSPTASWLPESTAVFDVNLDTLHVVIYQMSSAVGRGFPGVRSIEPWQDF